jgi:hypothetical protein
MIGGQRSGQGVKPYMAGGEISLPARPQGRLKGTQMTILFVAVRRQPPLLNTKMDQLLFLLLDTAYITRTASEI